MRPRCRSDQPRPRHYGWRRNGSRRDGSITPLHVVLAPLVLLLATLVSACAPGVYDRPYPIRPVALPRDDAAHRAPIEWWYYTGHLRDEEGGRYGFEVTFFKAYPPPGVALGGVLPASWLAESFHVAHVAITDLRNGRFVPAQRSQLWGYRAASSAQRLDVSLADWSVRRAADGVGHRLRATVPGYTLDLRLEPTKPAALHGDPPGIQSMGPGGESYYLSYTRMVVRGTLGDACGVFGCRRLRVTGEAWHDHQWGDFRMDAFAGWDWFSLQLDDGSEVMLYLIRGDDGGYVKAAGSAIDGAGRTTPLGEDDFALEPTGARWTSARTGATYPMGWRVRVPARGLDVVVRPALLDQEMDSRPSTGIAYWEGAVSVEAARDGREVGRGYVELTNYDRVPPPGGE